MILNLISGKISQGDIETELQAQIENVISAGINPTHFDSEKHLHVYPPMMRAVVKMANRFKTLRIRRINEFTFHPSNFANTQYYKMVLLFGFSQYSSIILRNTGILTTDHFIGVLDSGRMDADTYRRIDHLRASAMS